jgi:hypothetical protein
MAKNNSVIQNSLNAQARLFEPKKTAKTVYVQPQPRNGRIEYIQPQKTNTGR